MLKVLREKLIGKPTQGIVKKTLRQWLSIQTIQYSDRSIKVFTEIASIFFLLGVIAERQKSKKR